MKNILRYSLFCIIVSLSANPPSRLQNYIDNNFTHLDNYNPQETDDGGNTLLHLAAHYGNASAIEKLIQIDKNLLTQRNENGKLPLDFAYENSHFYIVNLLKSYYPTKLSSEYIDAIPYEIKKILSAKTKLYKNEFLEITQSLLIEECNRMLADTKKVYNYFNNYYTIKDPQATPEYEINEKNNIIINLEHDNSKKKYPYLWLILHKQINVLQNVHGLSNPIALKIIFDPKEKLLLSIDNFASPDNSSISIGSFYLFYYILFHFEPYTLWPIFAHEVQHINQHQQKYFLNQSIISDCITKNKTNETINEIDADYMIAASSLSSNNKYINFTQDMIAKQIYLSMRMYKIIKNYDVQTLLKSVHLIAEKIKDSDPYFTTRSLNLLKFAIDEIIKEALQKDDPAGQLEPTLKTITQKITRYTIKNYERLMQQYALTEYQQSRDSHPTQNIRNRNILKGRIITELDLLKKHYNQSSIIITHHNAPLLYHTIKQNLASGMLTNKSHAQSLSADPYHDISILLEFGQNNPLTNPMPTITKNHLTQKYELKFTEPFIIFALCAPKAHTVFSATFLQAIAQRQNIGTEPLDVYPEPTNAYTVFQTLYQILNPLLFDHTQSAIIAAQVAYVIPELAKKIHEPLTQQNLFDTLNAYEPLRSNTSDVSILENIPRSDIFINNLAYSIFLNISHMPYYLQNKNQLISEMPIEPESIEIKQLQFIEQLGYFTLINKILLTTYKSSFRTTLLELLIKFELNKCIENHIQNIKTILIENYDIHNTIFHAIAHSNLPLLQNLLDKNNENNERENINHTSIENLTPLHLASLFGNQKAVQILIDTGASLNEITRSQITILHTAALGGNKKIIRILKEKNAPDSPDKNGKTSQSYEIMMQQDRDMYDASKHIDFNNIDLFINALSDLDITTVSIFIKHGISINKEYAINETYTAYPLHAVCKIRNQNKNNKILAMIQTLLDHGADINAQDSQGMTPLLTALAARKDIKIIQYLLEHGADFSIQSKNNWSYNNYIFQAPNFAVIPVFINLFKEHGALFTERNNEGNTILHEKIKGSNYNHTKILIEHVPELLGEKNNDNNTPLHLIFSNENAILNLLPIINDYLNNPEQSTHNKKQIKKFFKASKNEDSSTPYFLMQKMQKNITDQYTRDIIQTTMQLLSEIE